MPSLHLLWNTVIPPAILLSLWALEKSFRGLKRKFGTHVVMELAKKTLPYRYHLLGSYLAFTEVTLCPAIREMWEINWNNSFISLKTHDGKFSMDWGWHKSKKMNPLPVLAAAKNAVCVAVMGILESERGTPDRLQVLKAEGEIKLSRCAGLASRSNNDRKFAREARKVSYLLYAQNKVFLAKQTLN